MHGLFGSHSLPLIYKEFPPHAEAESATISAAHGTMLPAPRADGGRLPESRATATR